MKALTLSIVVAAVLVLPAFVCAQNTPVNSRGAVQLQSGVVVEKVWEASDAGRAGIRPSDILLSWRRDSTGGSINSPYDVFWLAMEQAPRGELALQGLREGSPCTWHIKGEEWGIATRPHFIGRDLVDYNAAERLQHRGQLARAVFIWNALAQKARNSDQKWLTPWLLSHIGNAFANAKQWKHADVFYEKALGKARAGELLARSGLLLGWAGHLAMRYDSRYKELYREALALVKESAPESLLLARILIDMGATGGEEAEKRLNEAVAIMRKAAPNSRALAGALYSLAIQVWQRGDLDKAEEYQRESLKVAEELNPKSLLAANGFNNLGLFAWNRGSLDAAEAHLHQALNLYQEIGPSYHNVGIGVGINNALIGLGVVARDRGDFKSAEQYFREALATAQRVDPDGVYFANCLGNIAELAARQGDLSRAEHYYRWALKILNQVAPRHRVLPGMLRGLGNVLSARGDLIHAEKFLREALNIERRAPEGIESAKILQNLAGTVQKQGKLDLAEQYSRQAFEIWHKVAPGSVDEATSLHGLGDLLTRRGDSEGAEEFYRQALAIRQWLAPQSASYAETSVALGRIMRRQQRLTAAEEFYSPALDALESQTSRLGSTPDIRSEFRAQHQAYYREYVGLLMADHQPERAFEVLERSRAQDLLELLAAARVDVHQGADPSLVQQERSLQQKLTAKANTRVRLLSARHSEEDIRRLDRELAELLSSYQEMESALRTSSPAYAALTQPQPLTIQQIQQQLLEPDTLLLEYSLGEERSFLFMLGPDSIKAYELPPKAAIEKLARRAYTLLTAQNFISRGKRAASRQVPTLTVEADYQKTVAELSRMLLGPAAADLPGKRLLVVADGVLNYIPFALLPAPESFNEKRPVPLIVGHEIVNLPSASVLAELRRAQEGRPEPSQEIAVVADPVFEASDERVIAGSKPASPAPQIRSLPRSPKSLRRSALDLGLLRSGEFHLPRLLYTRKEAQSILAAAAPGHTVAALDFRASRAMAVSPELAQYRIIHFATHGLADSKRPELSGLVLSMVDRKGNPQDGFLGLEDIYNLKLPVDMVVLSGCQTALGREITGEGLISMTRGFMYAGASRVVASLWNVDDLATSELMAEFYRAMEQEKMRPAAALRKAQIALWKQKSWHSPYYWAAFQIQGEWR